VKTRIFIGQRYRRTAQPLRHRQHPLAHRQTREQGDRRGVSGRVGCSLSVSIAPVVSFVAREPPPCNPRWGLNFLSSDRVRRACIALDLDCNA
jgi:hypothetical protein